MMEVDVLQVFISTSAIFGIGLIRINFNENVFKTVRPLAAAPFSWPKKEDDSSGDCSDEEDGYWSDDCSEARQQIPEPPPFYIN